MTTPAITIVIVSSLVGERGRVISFEVEERHLHAAQRNVSRWAESLRCRGNEDWTKNVEFHLQDVKECEEIITEPVDGVS